MQEQENEEKILYTATDNSLLNDNIRKGTRLIFEKLTVSEQKRINKYNQFNLTYVYAVLIAGQEIVLRHLQLYKHFMLLIPSNEKYQPQLIDLNKTQVKILGQLVWILDNESE